MGSNIGFNVMGGKTQTSVLLNDIDRLDCDWVQLISEPKQANEIAKARSEMTVIYRDYWPPHSGDDSLHKTVTPAQYVNHMLSLDLLPNIVWYAGNEPQAEAQLSDWLISVMDLADQVGRRLVVGNFATGNPQPHHWQAILEPLLQRMAGTWHILGLHEYINENLPDSMPWHVGRYQFMLDACKKLGIEAPQIAITEHGFDTAGSWLSMDMPAEDFARSMSESTTLYAADHIPALMYSYGPWQSPGTGWDYNMATALPALAALEWPALKTSDKAAMPPESAWVPAVARPTFSAVNVRPFPHTNRPRIDTIRQPVICEYIDTQSTWWRIRYSDVDGWIHVNYVIFEDANQPNPDDGSTESLKTRIRQLETLNEALLQDKAVLQTENDALRAKLIQIASIVD